MRNSRTNRRVRKITKTQRTIQIVFRLTLLGFILATVISLLFFGKDVKAAGSEEECIYKYFKCITVESGDTLLKYAREYSEDNNYSAYVEEVISINHLKEDGLIIEGMYLTVPYYSKDYIS